MPNPVEPSLSKRLKAHTHDTHENIDHLVMAKDFFKSVDRYRTFLKIQYCFHRDVDPLYGDARLRTLLPDLAERRRLPLIAADLADLGDTPPTYDADMSVIDADEATALGWLYVAEGSNMGAALLRREAAKLGLSDAFGARHLAPAAIGPAPHWRAFATALDAVPLDAAALTRADAGAVAAFARVRSLVDARHD